MKNRNSLKRQQGVVIIIALFFVALIVMMASLMVSRLERDTRRTHLLLRSTQAEFYAQGSIAWAIDTLRDNAKNIKQNQNPKKEAKKEESNTRVDVIPIQSPVNKVNGYKIYSVITDMQARFNLNNLTPSDLESQKQFVHLLKIVDPALSDQMAQEIMLAIVDWISPGQQQNEFSKYYLSLSPAYVTAHRAMASASEVRLVKGMTPKLYQALEPYVTALPAPTLVNVQTAKAPVIASLSPTMTLETGLAIEKLQSKVIFATPQIFLNLDLIKNHNVKPDKITVVSQYFLVETVVTIEDERIVLYTLLDRPENGDPVNILWQSKNVLG